MMTKKRKDKAFLDWISYQPSCLSGRFNEYDDEGNGRSVACHHRTVARGAGTAIKPIYSAYPLRDDEHRICHQYGPGYYRPAQWWEEQAKRYYKMWLELPQNQK